MSGSFLKSLRSLPSLQTNGGPALPIFAMAMHSAGAQRSIHYVACSLQVVQGAVEHADGVFALGHHAVPVGLVALHGEGDKGNAVKVMQFEQYVQFLPHQTTSNRMGFTISGCRERELINQFERIDN